MLKIVFTYLDRKFPFKIETEDKVNSSFPGMIMRVYKSGDKRLFIKLIQSKKAAIKYVDANPSDLMSNFGINKFITENLFHLWVKERMKNKS